MSVVLSGGPATASDSAAVIPDAVQARCLPFDYGHQRLQGKLGYHLDLNLEKGLLRIPYDTYLDAYEPGQPSYWPSGEYLGKFLHGLVTAFRYSGDPRALEQGQRIVNTWIARIPPDGALFSAPNGYLVQPAYSTWSVWECKYELVGLLNYYEVVRYRPALDCARKIGDYLCNRFGEGKEDIIPIHPTTMVRESVLQPMVQLYRFTGDERYLDFCRYLFRAYEQPNGPRFISELVHGSGKVTKVADGKGYEMLSCLIGILDMHLLTGNADYLKAVTNAWADISRNHLFITGGPAACERFRDAANKTEHHKAGMVESCVTAHWIYLNRGLYHLTGDLKYADAMEQSIYNSLLGSQNPHTAQQSYMTTLIGQKEYNMPNLHYGQAPCCISSTQREVTRLPEDMWARFADHGLAVLLYNRARLRAHVRTMDGGDVPIDLDIDSEYPASGNVRLTLKSSRPARFRLALRVPSWTTRFEVREEGGAIHAGTPGTELILEREWPESTIMEVTMAMTEQMLEGAPDFAGCFAFRRGPVVLALSSFGRINPTIGFWHQERRVKIDDVRVDPGAFAGLQEARDRLPPNWIGNAAYTTDALKDVEGRPLVLVPFSDTGQIYRREDHHRVWIKGKDSQEEVIPVTKH